MRRNFLRAVKLSRTELDMIYTNMRASGFVPDRTGDFSEFARKAMMAFGGNGKNLVYVPEDNEGKREFLVDLLGKREFWVDLTGGNNGAKAKKAHA